MIKLQRYFRTLSLCFSFQLLLVSCSSVHEAKPTEDSPADLKRQILELQKAQAQASAQIEDLNNKVVMLSGGGAPVKGVEEKTAPAPAVAPPAPQRPREIKVNPLAPVAAPADAVREKPSTDPAFKVYSQVVLACKKPKLDEAKTAVDLMIKRYKDSPLTSNALYLYADTLYERTNYSKSSDEFERLYKLYPDGNKAVGALYRLALCYQKLGHPAEAQQAFENIVTLYPGSREALDSEKQIMNGQESSQ